MSIGAAAWLMNPAEAGRSFQDGRVPGTAARDAFGWEACQQHAGQWFVLHCKSRNEKALADDLQRCDVGCFLPLARTQRTYGARRAWVELPLFPGYLFLRGGADECEAAWKTKRLANILRVQDQQQLGRELEHIYRVVTSGEPVDLFPALKKGRRCRIVAGSLRGVEGVVLRRRSVSRMYISATVLGQSAMVEIDAALLEALD